MKDILCEKLNKLAVSLDKFQGFYEELPPLPLPYNPASNDSFQQKTQNLVVNNYYNPNPYPYWYFTQPTLIVKQENTENKKKEEEKKDENKTNVIVGTVMASALAITGTYMATKDEYVQLYMSEASSLLKEILQLSEETEFEKDTLLLNKYYGEWSTYLTKRSGAIFTGKSGIVASGFVTCAGIGLVSSSLVVGGIFGATASGCYLLWKYMMSNKDNEIVIFGKMIDLLNQLIISINKKRLYPEFSI